MAHTKLSASPRFPDDDSTNTVSFGLAIPCCSKSSTSPIAVLTLIEPVILNPSRFEGLAARIAHLRALELTEDEMAKIEEIRNEYCPKIVQALEGLKGTLTPEQAKVREDALKAGK